MLLSTAKAINYVNPTEAASFQIICIFRGVLSAYRR